MTKKQAKISLSVRLDSMFCLVCGHV